MSLVFFPTFLENYLSKVDKILGLTFFKARKDFEGLKTFFFFSFTVADFFFARYNVNKPRLFA